MKTHLMILFKVIPPDGYHPLVHLLPCLLAHSLQSTLTFPPLHHMFQVTVILPVIIQ